VQHGTLHYGRAVQEGATPAGAYFRYANLHSPVPPDWRQEAG